MPMQKVQAGILAKMGMRLVQAHEAHKNDAPAFGNQQLPAGIEGGVAQLIECHIGEYKEGKNKGSPYFMASGMVKRPVMKDGLKTFGMRTQIGPHPLCDTPDASGTLKTFADHWGWMLNQVRILAGIEGEMNLGSTPQEVEANLLALLSTLTTMKPHFRFRTWKGAKQELEQRPNGFYVGNKGPYPSEQAAKAANPYLGREPMLVQEWNGACDFTDDTDGSEGMEDATPPAVPNAGTSNGVSVSRKALPTVSERKGTSASLPSTKVYDDTDPQQQLAETMQGNSFDDQGDIDSLVARATADDGDAQNRLKDMAIANGATEDQVDNATDWQAVANLCMRAEGNTTEVVEEPQEPDNTPIKGGIYRYRPLDPKTRKPGTKEVEVEVLDVDPASQTCTLKNKSNPKAAPIKGVSWDALIV